MVDLYKKVMVKQSTEIANQSSQAQLIEKMQGKWKEHFQINPNLDEYGSKLAEIVDFAIVDEDGNITSSIVKGTNFTIKSKVEFYCDIPNPIFTYTFKSLKGTDITGTNTMYEKADIGKVYAGETYVASFEQDMNLQGGEYLLSISCTGIVDGELTVYHRLYDVINISVISDKNTVGFYDMNSKVKVEKVK